MYKRQGNNVAVDSNVTFDPSNSQTYINDYDPLNIVDQRLPLYSNTTVGEGANGGGRSKMRGGAGGGGDGGENTGGGGGTGGLITTGSGGTGYPGYGGSGGSGIVILRYPNTRTITIGTGLTGTTATVGSDKVTTFTAGTGTIQFD